jgi:cytoskeletal protein CcmA (bactofilin family)
VVSGTIEGDITIRMKLELTPTARIYGTISSAMIAIASGAIHEGDMHIEKEADVIRFQEKRGSPDR